MVLGSPYYSPYYTSMARHISVTAYSSAFKHLIRQGKMIISYEPITFIDDSSNDASSQLKDNVED